MTTHDPKGGPPPGVPTDIPGEVKLVEGQLPRPSDVPMLPGIASTTPGVSLASARVPGAPTMPDVDPIALGNWLGQLANQMFQAPPVVPGADEAEFTTSPPTGSPMVGSPMVGSPTAPYSPAGVPGSPAVSGYGAPATAFGAAAPTTAYAAPTSAPMITPWPIPSATPPTGVPTMLGGSYSPFDQPLDLSALATPLDPLAHLELPLALIDDRALSSPSPDWSVLATHPDPHAHTEVPLLDVPAAANSGAPNPVGASVLAPNAAAPKMAAPNMAAPNMAAPNAPAPMAAPDAPAPMAAPHAPNIVGPVVTPNVVGSNAVAPNVGVPNVAASHAPQLVPPNAAASHAPNVVGPVVTPNVVAPNVLAPNVVAPNAGAPNIAAPNIAAPNIAAPNIAAPTTSNVAAPRADLPATPPMGAPALHQRSELPMSTAVAAPSGFVFDTFEIVPTHDPAIRAVGSAAFDPYAIRREFPILNEPVRGKRLVWLDNAATTQKPQAVIDRLSYFYEHENSNIHRAAHTLAARATDAYEGARESVRRFIKAPSTRDIIFVRGTTEGINLIAQSWGRRNIGPGDEVLISWLEHHANIVPWQQVCEERGARLKVAPVDDRGQILLDAYERLLGPKVKLVSFTQVSNALGTITPAKQMIEMAHRHGAVVVLDGAQAVSHMPVDVQSLGCDFFVFSGHKVFGPTGIGAVYGRTDLLEAMPPWQGGGNMIQDVTFERTVYHGAPARFEAGTGNIADAVGLGTALDWLSRIGVEQVGRYEHELLEYGTALLREVPGLTMIGTAADKAGVLSFVLDGHNTTDVGGLLDLDGIAVRSGHHCAQPILRRFGVEASVRASLAPYNTFEDLDALAASLHRLQARRVPR